ncbi:MAG: DUF4116 domain-containing protein, partial [Cytophagaceae bacterium]
YIIRQGPSKNITLQDWNLFWATNKKYIDPTAKRYTAINSPNKVVCNVVGAPEAPRTEDKDVHAKNPELGTKKVVFSKRIILEQEDAKSFEDNEEITLMNWGNAIVRKKSYSLNPMQLLGLMKSADASLNAFQSSICAAAFDKKLWKQFSPNAVNIAGLNGREHAGLAFLHRWENLQTRQQELLSWLWSSSQSSRKETPPLGSLLWAVMTSILFGTSWTSKKNNEQWNEERTADAACFDIAAIRVRRNGLELSSLSPELRAERELVLAAVKQCGFALEDADIEFRRDLEIVLAAVQQIPSAREYAAEEIKNHPLIVEAADKHRLARKDGLPREI